MATATVVLRLCSAWLSIAGPRFGDYKAGFRFGQLGYDLVEQRGLKRFQARIYMNFRRLASCPGRDMSGLAAIWCVGVRGREQER